MKCGRNDQCFCQSGVKYKKCHALRKQQEPLSDHEFDAGFRAAWAKKVCLHPDAGSHSCSKVIAAHTLQRGNVLGALTDDKNHVGTFAPDMRRRHTKKLGFRSVGWNEASTFYGFCDVHDVMLAPIETQDFIHTPEQCFLVGYRALCHEIHKKQAAIRAYEYFSSFGDRGYSEEDQIEYQANCYVSAAGSRKGLASFLKVKDKMQKSFRGKDFTEWSSLVVYFDGNLCLASTGAVSPNRTVQGVELQMLHDPLSEQENIMFGVLRTATGGAVVFTWHKNHTICGRFAESLLELTAKQLPQTLVQFMFAYVENTYFSHAWWKSLTDAARDHIAHLATISNAYYSDIEYRSLRLVPWAINRVILSGREVAF